jgi:transcriptional regulator with XRE-family HTH domain
MDLSFKTSRELQQQLGVSVRALRLHKNLTQRELADKAGVSLRALASLENGKGSSLETFVRGLKALDAASAIESLAPQASFSPMALLKTPTPPRRARKPKRKSSL